MVSNHSFIIAVLIFIQMVETNLIFKKIKIILQIYLFDLSKGMNWSRILRRKYFPSSPLKGEARYNV